ncbi:hypothetical protein [Amycolatopsis sp. NPDC051903]|uniref:hypothetical protein n=1 Tax=Amycolatopsis sp. NPDC051903 TaxID=3363936 RepID=UPI0037B2D45D
MLAAIQRISRLAELLPKKTKTASSPTPAPPEPELARAMTQRRTLPLLKVLAVRETLLLALPLAKTPAAEAQGQAQSEQLPGMLAVLLATWLARMPVNPEAKARTFPLLNTLAALKSLGQAFPLAKRLTVSPTGTLPGQLAAAQSGTSTALLAAWQARVQAGEKA